MMYQDSIDQASEKAALTIAFLQRHRLAAHPVNYTVSYDYISGINAELCHAIEQKLLSKIGFDDFIMAELYSNFIVPTSKDNERLVHSMHKMVSQLAQNSESAATALDDYIEVLDHSLVSLKNDNPTQARETLHKVLDATYDLRATSKKLQDELHHSTEQSHLLRTRT